MHGQDVLTNTHSPSFCHPIWAPQQLLILDMLDFFYLSYFVTRRLGNTASQRMRMLPVSPTPAVKCRTACSPNPATRLVQPEKYLLLQPNIPICLCNTRPRKIWLKVYCLVYARQPKKWGGAQKWPQSLRTSQECKKNSWEHLGAALPQV